MIRCLIVDDNASFLDAATSVLQHDEVTVVGTARTIEQALRQAGELQPDVILVDVMLGDESGLGLARRLFESGSTATVVLISTHAEADLAELIDETPAAGFMPKSQLSAAAVHRLVSERRGR
ncbi:MAG TPA: response regulator [Jatrophihabitantaceae bacterium]|jgi:DNA-binding NarL/FixJ family response regulator